MDVLGESLLVIENNAFSSCSSLTSITLPNTLVSIDYKAFALSGLTSINIPSSVAKIGTQAFSGCYDLKAITVDANNPSYCDIDGVLCNKTKQILYQYPNAKGSDYEIPNTITKIEEYAFSLCKDVESLTIPASVGSIEYRALEGCSNLKKITCLRTSPISANFAIFCPRTSPSKTPQEVRVSRAWMTTMNISTHSTTQIRRTVRDSSSAIQPPTQQCLKATSR